jgi:hypothetical protein
VNAKKFQITCQQHYKAPECRSHHAQEEDLQTRIITTQHFDNSITAGEAEAGQ